MSQCYLCGTETNDCFCENCQKELMRINCEKMDKMIKEEK